MAVTISDLRQLAIMPERTCMFRTTPRSLMAFVVVVGFFLSHLDPTLGQNSGELNHWQVSLDQGKSFRPINVPGTVEDQADLEFDGVSVYKAKLPSLQLQASQRLLLHFHAVATDAKVYFDNQLVGQHLGGWTPFAIDLTDELNAAHQEPGRESWLNVEVDEKVGHNTQGFLPIVTKHFGGIWQPVTWELTNRAIIVDQAITVRPDFPRKQLVCETPVLHAQSDRPSLSYSIRSLRLSSDEPDGPWQSLAVASSSVTKADRHYIDSLRQDDVVSIYSDIVTSPADLKRWSPASPQRYEIRIQVKSATGEDSESASTGTFFDTAQVKVGFRSFDVAGDRFRLNEQPLSIRGLLNWGYAPPSVAPSLDESWMNNEIRFAQARGFNMMKFCLWVPPERYLELCDELGMLAWIEYPTWHPQLDKEHFDELKREYSEFYEHDRNHCSIVLRSLTCETGPSADLDVVKSLYRQCKQLIPGAIVEDDSSWIEWNRVHDFYDDHPYSNNHTWVPTLARLKGYISEREQQPLVLGESMAADTWTVPTEHALQMTQQQPAHAPLSIADALRWQTEIGALAAKRNRTFDSALLLPQSRHYGMLMRKYQIETFHREVPRGGYVVSVIRDFPKAAMGLIDFDNRPKHPPDDWAFQNDRMLILTTENDRRSFDSGGIVPLSIMLKNDAVNDVPSGQLQLDVIYDTDHVELNSILETESVAAGEFLIQNANLTLPPVTVPRRLVVRVQWKTKDINQTNEWPIWVFPQHTEKLPELVVHPSATAIAGKLPIRALAWKTNSSTATHSNNRLPILARHFDAALLGELASGRRVLMIPDGEAGSFPLTDHWFLRGGPVVLPRINDSWQQPFSLRRSGQSGSQNMLVELQHFDLAGPVVAKMDPYLELTDPSLVLWDNHDLSVVNTHGLVFEMSVGAGALFVSTLNHIGQTNSAGRWLFREFYRQLTSGSSPLGAKARETTLHRLESEVNRRGMQLHETPWKFQPDPIEMGVNEKWFATDFDDSHWSEIRVDQHWESQGHEALDGWAWYRKSIKLGDNWKSETTYLNFTGIDDYALIYVNGRQIGTAGDLETKRTAFEDRLSFDVSGTAKAGETLQITVAVYDWFGAGGIFRPVTLSTEPLSENPPMLK